MRILSFLILFCGLLMTAYRTIQSPHGPGFKVSCKTCHSTKGWQLDKQIYSFDHNSTRLPLSGQHSAVNCRGCHPTLIFSDAKSNCIDCHSDVHQSTVGPDCSRCHTPESWLVSNITDIHRMSRFPLVGAHRNADCIRCHKSENPVRFEVPGVNCIDCHRNEFMATTNPNHVQAGFSEDCSACHMVNAFQWPGAGFNHTFFPLVLGHSNAKCADCHTSGNYKGANRDCNSCHQQDYMSASNPDHNASGFPTACQECHSLNPGWKPATFNHNSFPLTLGHSSVDCVSCHTGGNYTSVSTECSSCHIADYNSTTNPNHVASKFSTQCKDCHTTNPGWKPATFNHSFFPLTLGHASVSCVACHPGGDYTSTSSVCSSCHLIDYNATTNPPHKTLNFSQVCLDCHTTNPGWKPATYKQHDAQFFPIYSGKHNGKWNKCTDCHTNATNYAQFNCIVCHANAHRGSNYTNAQCYQCHPTGIGGDRK